VIEEIDPTVGRVFMADGVPPMLVVAQISVGCECITFVGHRLDDADAIKTWAAFGAGEVSEELALHARRETLCTATLACTRHSEDGSAQRFNDDFDAGVRDPNSDRDDLPLDEVIDELMARHLR
jgi:hypothetical protein